MAIINTNKSIGIENANFRSVEIPFICPICKIKKDLPIDKSILNHENLTTISIPSGVCCNHSFQAFIDKQFKVRGYQKVDFEFSKTHSIKEKNKMNNYKTADKILIENLVLNGNHVEYRIMNDKKSNSKLEGKKKLPLKEETNGHVKRKITKKEIYDEFWDFIDENNEEFKNFIIKDPRRRTIKEKNNSQ